MAILGQAALAMWWGMAPELRADFEHWHSHEHFPERLGLPGFLRASRWLQADGGDGVFVLYELAEHAALSSPAYLARLNAPTPWSKRLMPHHRNMVRCQCRVVESHGPVVARHAVTVRFPVAGGGAGVATPAYVKRPGTVERPRIVEWPGIVKRAGISGVHLLRHEAPAIAATTEQQLRGGADAAAQEVLLVIGYDAAALEALLKELPLDGATLGRYQLSASATPADIAP